MFIASTTAPLFFGLTNDDVIEGLRRQKFEKNFTIVPEPQLILLVNLLQ